MNAWARRKGKSDYAEWFPELDLHIASRWEGADEEAQPGRPTQAGRRPVVLSSPGLAESAGWARCWAASRTGAFVAP